MTTITRERAQEIFLGNGPEPTASEQRELARIALASLTAKPIAHTSQYGIDLMIRDNAGLLVQAHGGNAYEIPLYTTPPAPIVPEEHYQRLSELYHAQEKRLFKIAQRIKGPAFDKYAHSPSQAIDVLESALFGENEATCRAAMLQANQRDLSQPVDPQVADYEKTMLQAGWVMVPVEPTDEMIAAALECEGVIFDSKDPTAFCVQYREIYCAMVDAALALNKGEY